LRCILTEIPDIAFPVLDVPVEGIFSHFPIDRNGVVHLDACNSIDDASVMSDLECILLPRGFCLIHVGCARSEREISIIDPRSKVSRINHWIVGRRAEPLTGLLSYLKSTLTGLNCVSPIGCDFLFGRFAPC